MLSQTYKCKLYNLTVDDVVYMLHAKVSYQSFLKRLREKKKDITWVLHFLQVPGRYDVSANILTDLSSHWVGEGGE